MAAKPPAKRSADGEKRNDAATSLSVVLSSKNGFTSKVDPGRFFAAGTGEGTFGLLDTGAVLWSSSKTLSCWLECDQCGIKKEKEMQKKGSFGVLELGAGFGLPGLVAASLLAHNDAVALTDVDTAVAVQRANDSIIRNTISVKEREIISFFPLDWNAANVCGGGGGSSSSGGGVGGGSGGSSSGGASETSLDELGWVNVFIAADVLYEKTLDSWLQLAPNLLGVNHDAAPEIWMVNTPRAAVHRFRRRLLNAAHGGGRIAIIPGGCPKCIGSGGGGSGDCAWRIVLSK